MRPSKFSHFLLRRIYIEFKMNETNVKHHSIIQKLSRQTVIEIYFWTLHESTHMKRTQCQDYVLSSIFSDHALQLRSKALADYQGQYKAGVNGKGRTPVL